MAQWYQIGGALRRHDAGEPRGAEHIALLRVALLMTTRPSAPAMLSVRGFADTSTIRASPLLSMWVRAEPCEDLRAIRQRVPVARGASPRANSARVAAVT